MKRINSAYLSGMSQIRTFRLLKDVYNKLEEIDDERFQVVCRSFRSGLENFHAALNSIPGKELSQKIARENSQCDHLWNGMRQQAEQLAASTDITNRKVGAELESLLTEPEDITSLSGDEKIKAIECFISKACDRITYDHMDYAGIDTSLSELNRHNWVHKQYMDAFTLEAKGQCITRETLKARREIEKTYASVVEFVNAMVVYRGTSRYDAIIDAVNDLTDKAREKPAMYDIAAEAAEEEESTDPRSLPA